MCCTASKKGEKVPFFRAHTLAEFGRSRLTACENSGFSVPVGHFDGAALGQSKIGPRQQQQQGESVLVSVCVRASVSRRKSGHGGRKKKKRSSSLKSEKLANFHHPETRECSGFARRCQPVLSVKSPWREEEEEFCPLPQEKVVLKSEQQKNRSKKGKNCVESSKSSCMVV